jgi:pimeloyl-ACP methyl ester carboxylesterase
MQKSTLQSVLNLALERQHGRAILLDVRYPETTEDKPLVIFCHGFKGFKDWGPFPYLCESMARAGNVVVSFNFSHNGIGTQPPWDHYGDLEGFARNTLTTELEDLGAVLDWAGYADELIAARADTSSIAVIGHSRGGGIVLARASEDPRIKKLITWAAVTDFAYNLQEEVLQQWEAEGVRYIPNARTGQQMPMYYSYVEDYYAHQERLDLQKAAERITQPMLIVHGTNDETLPFETAIDLKRKIPHAKLCLIPAATHTFDMKHPWDGADLPFNAEVLLKETLRFLEK